jgi:hypothetical protein
VTLSALVFFADAATELAAGTAQGVREQWWSVPGHLLGGVVLTGFWIVVNALVGIGLLRRRRSAFVVALLLAGLRVLPLPAVPTGRILIYAIGAAFAAVVIVLLIRDRKWFWPQEASD